MSDKSKKIDKKKVCKICKGKFVQDNLDKYIEMVKDAEYVCKKCGRVAKDKKNICKPKNM